MEKYKKFIILFSILAVGIIVISVVFALKDDDTKKHGNQNNKEKADSGNESLELSGTLMMVTDIDLDSSSITVEELDTGEEHKLTFTGSSDIRTKNLRIISAAYLQKGNIALVDYDENGRLISLVGSDKVWSYKDVYRIRIDQDLGRIELGKNIYRCGKYLKVLNDDEFVPLDSIAVNGMDMIDIYGIDNIIYLIKVASGHGYLTLTNYDDFLEGYIYYGMGKCEEVTENLRIMLPEGEQEITVQKDGMTANAIIRIANNEESCFDLEGYGAEPAEYKNVTFNISPSGSLLYVDGVKTSYAEQVSLTSGFHVIEVELGGYNSYRGSIEVISDGMVKNITLSPQPTAVPDDVLYDNFEDSEDNNSSGQDSYQGDSPSNTSVPDNPDFSNYSEDDIPDNTSVGNDDENIEVIDGDSSGNNAQNNRGNGNSDNYSGNISIVGDNDDEQPEVTRDAKQYSGEMTIYCSEGTEIYIDDVYKGRVSNGSLTTPKPVGTIELKLVKKGYVTKRYVLTMDSEEEASVFKFPEMTPES